jgi:hypothetical protein
MNDESGKKIEITEAELIQLMRRLPKTSSAFKRPEDSFITSYLLCEATDSEKTVIEEAMLNSTDFRSEILQLAKGIDSLAIERVGSVDSDQITAPDRQTFLNKHATKPVRSDLWRYLIGHLKRLIVPQIYVPAVVTAASVLLIFYLRTEPPHDRYVADNLEWRLEEVGLDRNLLRSKQVRGPSRPLISEAKADARTAALSEMRELLTYTDGTFEFSPTAESQQPPSSFHQYVLQITDSTSKYSELFSVFVPSTPDSPDHIVGAWLLTLPSQNLYKIDLLYDSLIIAWPSVPDDSGCLVVTYRDNGGFRAFRGLTIDLGD